MKATTPWLGSALVVVLAVSAAAAQCPGGHGIHQAPDACGPGYYAPNEYGLWFGPNYAVHPPCLPFNGMVFAPGAGPGAKDGAEAQGGSSGGPGTQGGPAGPYGRGAPGGPGGPYGPGISRGPVGPYGPYGYYGPRPAAPGMPGTLGGPYALNGPGGPGAMGGPPGLYRGPSGYDGLQGPGSAGPGGPTIPYAPNGPAGPNNFRFSLNTGARPGQRAPGGPGGPSGQGASGGPYGPYAAYDPGSRMVPYPYDGAACDNGQLVPPPVSFPTHMWARSPRDFFMEGDETPAYPISAGYGASSAPSPRPYVPTEPFPAPLTPPPLGGPR
jgi:hypothetical protein